MDHSNGYEAISAEWLRGRGSDAGRARAIGVDEVRRWARTLPAGSSVIDIGCGPGFPLTAVLVEEGLRVYGLDAAPSFVAAFQRNLPGVPITCASVLESDCFGRKFDAVLAVGLIFLMTVDEQARLLRKFAEILNPDGHLLFTAPLPACTWIDQMTGLSSVSLGGEEYRRQLALAGLSVVAEFEDVGENHYYEVRKTATAL
ncbi:class I SAM-dependent methyltransferase [Terriglobus roseus]|uniref:Methyltransferase domain-containing protein n=1 Tax=Terriglobus roseus TaxID=392734 RepID=A0A1G7PTJ0_9BACT|nr:class I SAM-dependent methyltransferase [Terriglobus roseus]SDF89541.1 Methyltransferase domain-containing protein [Terriglobus roseus]